MWVSGIYSVEGLNRNQRWRELNLLSSWLMSWYISLLFSMLLGLWPSDSDCNLYDWLSCASVYRWQNMGLLSHVYWSRFWRIPTNTGEIPVSGIRKNRKRSTLRFLGCNWVGEKRKDKCTWLYLASECMCDLIGCHTIPRKLRWKEEREIHRDRSKGREIWVEIKTFYQKYRKRDREQEILCFKRWWEGRQAKNGLLGFTLNVFIHIFFQILLFLWMTGFAVSYHCLLKLIEDT